MCSALFLTCPISWEKGKGRKQRGQASTKLSSAITSFFQNIIFPLI